MLRDDTVLSSR